MLGAASLRPGMRMEALQYLQRTVLPRAAPGTARILRHVSVGHMIRIPLSALGRGSLIVEAIGVGVRRLDAEPAVDGMDVAGCADRAGVRGAGRAGSGGVGVGSMLGGPRLDSPTVREPWNHPDVDTLDDQPDACDLLGRGRHAVG